MKKYLLLIAFLNYAGLVAQNKIAQKVAELQRNQTQFKTISVLTPTLNTTNKEVDKVVENATLATLKTDQINEIMANGYEYVELEIPYQNQTISLLLYKVNPFAEGFHVDTDKDKNIAYQKGIYYRGIIKGDSNSVSSFNFFNGECNGIFSSSALGNVVVGKLTKPNNLTDYIVYSDAKMKILNQFDCHVKEDSFTPSTKTGTNKEAVLSTRCVTLYFEIDYNLFIENDSNTTTTSNWMTSVFNNVQTLYGNDGISVALKSLYIWTEEDPYEGIGDSSYDYLQAFNEHTPVFDGDLGQLVGIDDGGLGGVAVAIDGLCSQNNYSYSDLNVNYNTVPTFSWTIEVITHELGHLMGSPHTHGCYWNGNDTAIDGCGQQAGYQEGTCDEGPIPTTDEKGTIMSYCHLVAGVGINFNNGFGPQPAALVLSTVNASTCLSTDCINTCINSVVGIVITNTTANSVSVTWSDLGNATSWQVAVTPFSSTNIVWNTVTTASYTTAGLNPNTYYKIRVRPLCVNAQSASRQAIFATNSANLCSFSFTDTGGTSNQYTDMESWVRTMRPTGNGLKIKVTFISFNLEADYDYLYIYNGPDDTYTELTPGGLTGPSIPGSYTSTSSSGALTFKFTSDQAETRSGWNANITCTGTLGEESNDFIDYSYYPNPTNGSVAISSKDVIIEVTVYNVQGQLLFTKKMNDVSTNVDLSKFADGTYFFKLKFDNNEANFKILKMN